MRKSIIAAITAISAIGAYPTHAKDWWIVNTGEGQCITAASAVSRWHDVSAISPAAFQTSLRKDGLFRGLNITRDDNDNVLTVTVTAQRSPTRTATVVYAATRVACEYALHVLIDGGTVGEKGELN